MRLLHVITRLPVGGAERLLVDIVRHLPSAQYQSLVCCIQDRGELAADIEGAGVRVVCLDRMQSKRFDWRAVRDLASLMRSERIDLVHTHLYHANLYGRLAALGVGLPVIATVHNTYHRTKLHRRLINCLLGRASTRVIAVSDDIRRDLVRYDWIPEAKIATVENGLDVSRVASALSREEARARLHIPEPCFALGCVARLEEQKGHRFLIIAVALLIKEAPEVAGRMKIFLVGDGRLRQELERQASSLGVQHIVRFLGTRHDVADILKALDGYVLASLWEGLSVALLEAMAAGLPAIASDVGGVSRVLLQGECGFKVPPGDVSALAQAIRELYAQSPQRRAVLGAQARKRVCQEFSLDAMMRRLTQVYAEAAGR